MKRKIFLMGFVIIIFSLLIFSINMNKRGKDSYIMHYYKGNYIYDIELKGNSIYIDKNAEIQCIKAPCDLHRINSAKIKSNNKYQKFIESLFKKDEDREINIDDNDLDDKESKIISMIIKNNNK